VLLVTAYWRINLTMRQIGPLFGVSHSAAHRVIDTLGPLLALAPLRRRRLDQVTIFSGSLTSWKVPSATARRVSPAGPWSYSGMTGAVASAPPNLVGVAPGSTMVRPMPNGSISPDLAGVGDVEPRYPQTVSSPALIWW
jgi:hypothetical protein